MNDRGAYLLKRDAERRRERLWIPKGAGSIFEHQFSDKSLERMANLADDLGAHGYSGGWVNLMNFATAVAVPAGVNSFTTITAVVSPFPDTFIQANSLHIGTRLRMICWGTLQSAAGSATFTLGATVGATAGAGNGGTGVLGATAAGTPATGTLGWFMHYESTVQVIGAASTASIIGYGFSYGIGATSATVAMIPATVPTALSTIFSTTVAQNMVPTSVCSASSATNQFTTYGYSVEQLN